MSEHEFDILDELYFVVSYDDLKSTLSLTDSEICAALQSLIQKGYVKILYPDQDTEHEYNEANFGQQCQDYFYLATKAGLVVHNSI
jgi:predicted transcriptional regulator